MNKLKLKPSQRNKRRYLLINEKDNSKIEKVILDYLGILGFAKTAYVKVKLVNGKIIGSVLRKELENVRAALGLVGISISKVSGTIKGLR